MITKFLSFLILLSTTLAFTQTVNVKGTVKDLESGQPLIGVNVIVKNTSKGASTDFDGNFNIDAVGINSILVFSYVGYQNQEVMVLNDQPITVMLREDAEALDEIVVIGYGTQKVTDVSGAISTVKSETIENLK